MILALLVLAAQPFPAQLTGFERRWEEMKRQASPGELYRILWDVPKGGDLHNHHRYSVPMAEWLARADGKLYYTRVRISACEDDASPLAFHTVRASTLEKLSACLRGDYKRMSELTREEREA